MMTIFRSFCQNRDQLPKKYLQVIYAILLFQLCIVLSKYAANGLFFLILFTICTDDAFTEVILDITRAMSLAM